MELKRFFVSWEIELDAEDPRDAARQALAMQRDPDSTAQVFTVIEMDDGSAESEQIDLWADDEEEETPVNRIVYGVWPNGDLTILARIGKGDCWFFYNFNPQTADGAAWPHMQGWTTGGGNMIDYLCDKGWTEVDEETAVNSTSEETARKPIVEIIRDTPYIVYNTVEELLKAEKDMDDVSPSEEDGYQGPGVGSNI